MIEESMEFLKGCTSRIKLIEPITKQMICCCKVKYLTHHLLMNQDEICDQVKSLYKDQTYRFELVKKRWKIIIIKLQLRKCANWNKYEAETNAILEASERNKEAKN